MNWFPSKFSFSQKDFPGCHFSWPEFTLGISEADLAETIGCNPSLHQESEPVDLKITGNEAKVISQEIEEKEEPTEPLSDLDFVSSQTSQ